MVREEARLEEDPGWMGQSSMGERGVGLGRLGE
jgi:hypothetical protein